jgi:ATP-dependent Lon protease
MPKKSNEIKDKSKKSPPKINNLKLKKPQKNDDSEGDESDWISDDENSDEEINEDLKKYLKTYKKSPKYVDEKEKNKKNKNDKIVTRSVAKKNNIIVDDYYDEDEDEDEDYIPGDDDDYDEEYDDDDDDEYEDDAKNKKANFNIFFTIGGDNSLEYEDEDDEQSDTENEDDDISSSSESEEDELIIRKNKNNKNKNINENNNKNKKNINEKNINENNNKNKKNINEKNINEKNINEKNINEKNKKNNINDEIDEVDEVKESEENYNEDKIIELLEKMNTKKSSNLVSECISLCKEKILTSKKKQEKKNKKEKERNVRIFKRIMYDKNTMNDLTFFNKLELSQQKNIIKELREINKIIRSEKPYRLTLLESNIPTFFKAVAMKKISLMRHMDVGDGEYYKIKNWVDTFMRIPFGVYKTLPITITNGIDNCTEFMENSRKILDDAVYGLNDAKMQIMQLLGQLITNPSAVGSAIGIHGSPGVGKTNLAREGISKILGRPFAFIALGGATDSSFLEGHSYTYEGSSWGKIVQILIDSKCMNPVIYFDELDKVSETPKGDEIIGILTHLIDTSQNNQFHDRYFAEIDFDLSKCLFIFTYNDESKINPILKDRMYKIQIKNYNKKEKTIIANNYLLPKIRDQVKFNFEDIIVNDDIIHYIVDTYCDKEDGVRNLKRCLEIIHTKLNLCRLVKPGSSIFEENTITNVQFPLTITKDIVDKLIKQKDMINPSLYHMYI